MEKGHELLEELQLQADRLREDKEDDNVREKESEKERQQQQQRRRQQRRRVVDERRQRQRLHRANQAFRQIIERLQFLAEQMRHDIFEAAAQRGLEHLRRVERDLAASLADPQACIEAHLAKWATTSAASSSAERQQSIREEVELILANPEAAMQRARETLEEMAASRRTPEERKEEHRRQEDEEEKQRQSRREDPQQKARRIMLESFDRSAHFWRRNPTMLRRVEADRGLYAADPEAWSQAQDVKRARWWDELQPEDRGRLQAELDAVNLKYKDKPNSSLARLERRSVDDKARSVVWKRVIQASRRRRLREQQEKELERERLERRAAWGAAAPSGLAASFTSAGAAASTSGQISTVTPATAAAAAADSESEPPATISGTQGSSFLAQ